MGKQITRAFRDNLTRVARVQLFQHGTPEWDLREGFEFLIASELGYLEQGVELKTFVAKNRAQIEPIVSEAIQRARKAGKL
jgi:hypothetical protein